MTGFNLPPGCSVSDIPGNRPEDIEYERRRDGRVNALIAELRRGDGGDAEAAELIHDYYADTAGMDEFRTLLRAIVMRDSAAADEAINEAAYWIAERELSK
jgi:hypothetical protein